MNCQIILQKEIFEKYILGHIEEAEKSEFELHLKKCVSCRKELENQKQLIAGIREFGRREMKNEIRQQVEIQKADTSQLNWTRIIKVAAILFVVVMTPSLIYIFQKQNQKILPVSSDVEIQILPEESAVDSVRFFSEQAELSQHRFPKTTQTVQQEEEGSAPLAKAGQSSAEKRLEKIDSEQAGLVEQKSKLFIVEADERVIPQSEPTIPPKMKEPTATEKETNDESESKRKSRTLMAPLTALDSSRHAVISEMPKIESSLTDVAQETRHKKGKAGLVKDTRGLKYQAINLNKQITSELFSLKPDSSSTKTEFTFKLSDKIIQVHFEETDRQFELAESTFPPKFLVKIVYQDSLLLEMNWYVHAANLNIEPSDVSLKLLQDDLLQVVIKEKTVYIINLNHVLTRAVLQKESNQ